jgi:cell division protease FtsH
MLDDDNKNKDDGRRPVNFNFGNNRLALMVLLILIGVFVAAFFVNDRNAVPEIPYSSFIQYLDQSAVDAVKIVDQYEIQGTLKGKTGNLSLFKTNIPYNDPGLMGRLEEKQVKVSGAVKGLSAGAFILNLLPWIIGFFFIWLIYRQAQGTGNKAFSFGKSKARRYHDTAKKITFADVAGQKEAKYELEEVVEFLKNPQKFTKMGAKIPKGVLLVGMPGTGKTLLAKAVAGEANVSFFHMSGSDFVEMFVGVGASRVRDLFEQGRRNAPCIIFIDELDAVGRTRGAGYGGGHDEREQTLNQMLVEMDGFDTKDGVIILAATNRPDVLDPALLRPGRFDRQVVVAMPDIQEREDILKIHTKKVPLAPDVDISVVARATPGTSGADLANLVNEAALFAARSNKGGVDMSDFEEARDKILMGIARKSLIVSDDERKATAYHESGHALLHYYLKHAEPLHKVTIIPHGRAMGVTMSLPDQDVYSRSRSWLQDRISIFFGGYVAERLVYSETTTGTKQDLQMATDMARKMVCEWGMADDVGPISLGQEDEPIFLGKEIATHKDYSEDTAMQIDNAIRRILDTSMKRASDIIAEHRDQLELLTQSLLTRETLLDSDIRSLLGFGPPKERLALA